MKQALLDDLLAARAARRAVAVVTDLGDGGQRLVGRGEHPGIDGISLDDAFRFDRSGVHRVDVREYFVHIHNPPLRLVIVGAVHIAQAVIPVAQGTGYDVVVVDPRGAFATGARFPGVALHAEWPDEVLPSIGLDGRTAMIALTHDPKIDDPALLAAIASDVFYIGALGSRKTQASRAARLKAAGAGDEQLDRIRGPIGLEIGARGAPEIAVAIMAQMIQHLRLGH